MKLMKVYMLICDGGDGSASIRMFRDPEKVARLLEQEDYYMNEGDATVIEVPEDAIIKFQDDNKWLFEDEDDDA